MMEYIAWGIAIAFACWVLFSLFKSSFGFMNPAEQERLRGVVRLLNQKREREAEREKQQKAQKEWDESVRQRTIDLINKPDNSWIPRYQDKLKIGALTRIDMAAFQNAIEHFEEMERARLRSERYREQLLSRADDVVHGRPSKSNSYSDRQSSDSMGWSSDCDSGGSSNSDGGGGCSGD